MGYRTLRVAGGVTFWCVGVGKLVLEVVVSLRACAWSLDLGQVVCAGGIHRARPLAALPAAPRGAVLPAVLPAALPAVL